MVNNVIEVVNYVIAAGSSLLNFMIADRRDEGHLSGIQRGPHHRTDQLWAGPGCVDSGD
jgi:hypothetical protein